MDVDVDCVKTNRLHRALDWLNQLLLCPPTPLLQDLPLLPSPLQSCTVKSARNPSIAQAHVVAPSRLYQTRHKCPRHPLPQEESCQQHLRCLPMPSQQAFGSRHTTPKDQCDVEALRAWLDPFSRQLLSCLVIPPQPHPKSVDLFEAKAKITAVLIATPSTPTASHLPSPELTSPRPASPTASSLPAPASTSLISPPCDSCFPTPRQPEILPKLLKIGEEWRLNFVSVLAVMFECIIFVLLKDVSTSKS